MPVIPAAVAPASRARRAGVSSIPRIGAYAALFGMVYFCTLYLQQVLGYSALKTGVAYLPFSVALVASSAGASASGSAAASASSQRTPAISRTARPSASTR